MKIEALLNKCTGCGACSAGCPKNCIQMFPDEEGFLCPVIGDGCIKCGKCDSICPVINHVKEERTAPVTYVAYNKNREERVASSSGGLFVLLAKCIINDGGIVYGAGFDSQLQVCHKRVDNISALEELQGSKYVQSRIDSDIYKNIKSDLASGKKVLFCGTPCQASALNSYIGEKRDDLYIVTFICHGVPSPKMWSEYLALRQQEYSSNPVNASFKNKDESWERFSLKIEFENGKNYRKNLRKDPYLLAFLKNTNLRESCYECSFKGLGNQNGVDLILADWWGYVKADLPGASDGMGASSIFVMSELGKMLWNSISELCDYKEMSFERIAAGNIAYDKSCSRNPARDFFVRDTDRNNFLDNARRYAKQPFSQKVKFVLVDITKKLGIKDFLKKLLGR